MVGETVIDCEPSIDNLDKELEKRGHKFVRYADDFMIFCRSQILPQRFEDSDHAKITEHHLETVEEFENQSSQP